ncbi:uncharacterized protein LOC114313201 [Camellia sinensis]|uniref:uncharacterized protein LOC114313201 n=1 Tax=Camellia sinensis TaxID=4442 RepID=UPI001036F0B5|nr:uncharacterized protein LOC114313201 [Camellia sinensis]
MLDTINVNGTTVDDPKEIRQVVYNHFKEVSKEYWRDRPKITGSFNGSFNVIPQCYILEVLEKEFTEAEVWKVVKKCDGNKAPGPDGFNLIYIQKGWQDKATSLNEYRPISLIGSIYKILSKILTNRLKKVLSEIISEVQTAFLGGRNVMDGILIANEVVYWWMKNNKKARISILVNGSLAEEFSPQKGLRQCDPLSPFSFNIAAEGLNILLTRAKDLGLVKGTRIGVNDFNISHLQFVNDTIIFCEAEWEEIVNIKRILRCFEVMFGLKINFHKSVVCGIGVSVELVEEFAAKLNCSHQNLPLKYLGLPLGANPRIKAFWKPILDKYKVKLAGWKRKVLSFTGRITMIKAVTSNLPLYYMSIFRIPVGVAKEIENVQANFLWEDTEVRRKVHIVKWKELTINKAKGGLGIHDIRIVNSCLLLKWWWRFGFEKNALWKNLICSKYKTEGGK